VAGPDRLPQGPVRAALESGRFGTLALEPARAALAELVDGNDTAAGDNIPDLVLELAAELQHTPRHLGIHSGGMVIADRPIIEVCPVEWARMDNRSVLQWDKDDCAAIGLTKFDLLGLGMLSALRYTFELVEAHHRRHVELYDIPADDPLVYDMLCQADTVGVFQIESRAQQSTSPGSSRAASTTWPSRSP
jgi:error-prone DNA polymerase